MRAPYDLKKMTLDMSLLPTEEACQSLISSLRSQIESSREAMSKRMEHYYDCQDDYSYGGICDQAASQSISMNAGLIRQLEDQMARGTAYQDEFRRQVLTDLEGVIVSDQIIDNKYGTAWIVRDGEGRATFVNTAHKASTYRAKGYMVMTIVETVQYYYQAKTWSSKKQIHTELYLRSVITDVRMEEAIVERDSEDELGNPKYGRNELAYPHTRETSPVYFADNNPRKFNTPQS